jgi:iron complex outermembrane receptor protein
VDDWRVSLNVKNLLDRRIDYNCSYSANAETCYVQEPLSATMRVARSF